jgi:hypothetical protein
MNLTKYTVVTSDDFGKFEDRVNQLLGEGWQLQGGVASVPLPDSGDGVLHLQWSQALILPAGAAVLEAEEEFAEALPRDLESVALPIEFPGDERPAHRRRRFGMPNARREKP